jgi:hypothetical protein
MANRNWMSNKLYQMEAYPVLITCNFVVDSTNGNGLGIRSLKGGAVKTVFMKTSATPAAGSPNPETGVIEIQLQDNYSRALLGMFSAVSKTDGSNQTSTTAGRASVITVLGTATTAQWQAVGLSVGVTPAVGVCFVATTSAVIGGSAAVQRPVGSGVATIETCGDPNLSLSLANSQVNGGSLIVVQCLDGSNTRVAPADGSVISLGFYLSNSSVTVQGQ